MTKFNLKPSRLCEAARRSRLMMQRQRDEFRELARRIAGNHYSDNGYEFPILVNLLSMYLAIVGRSLISQNPRFLYSTTERQLRPTVRAMQYWVNAEVDRMRLSEKMQSCVASALCSIGMGMVHLASPMDAARYNWGVEAGDPIFSTVPLENLVVDMQALDWDELGYIGYKGRYPLYAVQHNKFYDRLRKDLPASTQQQFTEQGDERASAISRGTFGSYAIEAEDMVDLWHIYSARFRTWFTFSDAQFEGISEDEKPLEETGFIGPDRGPFYPLVYGRVPDNLWPKAPMMDLIDCDEACNTAMRKLADIIDRIKEITLVDGPRNEIGETILRANDGEIHMCPGADSAKQIVFSGQHAQIIDAIGRTFKELFSFVGGNLELLGGRSQQAGTKGQEELLQQNASAGIMDLQDRTHAWVTRIGEAFSWYYWKHPKKVMNAEFAPAGLQEFSVPTPIYPGNHPDSMALRRLGPMPAVRCDPYTLKKQTPDQKAQLLKDFVMQMYAPMAQLFMSKGMDLNIQFIAERMAEYMDSPDLAEALNVSSPSEETGMSHERGSRMPQETERTYTRKSESAKGANQDRNIIAAGYGSDLGGSRNGQMQEA